MARRKRQFKVGDIVRMKPSIKPGAYSSEFGWVSSGYAPYKDKILVIQSNEKTPAYQSFLYVVDNLDNRERKPWRTTTIYEHMIELFESVQEKTEV